MLACIPSSLKHWKGTNSQPLSWLSSYLTTRPIDNLPNCWFLIFKHLDCLLVRYFSIFILKSLKSIFFSNHKPTYFTLQVNENGLLSFLTEIPSFFNIEFPLDYPIIAALYSDVDCRSTGSVWHRVSSSADVLDRSTKEVEKYFPKLSKRFRAEEVIVVTWEKVGYFDNKSDRVKNNFKQFLHFISIKNRIHIGAPSKIMC